MHSSRCLSYRPLADVSLQCGDGAAAAALVRDLRVNLHHKTDRAASSGRRADVGQLIAVCV